MSGSGKIAILLLAFLFLPETAFSASILIFGDSLSAGYGLPAGKSWVNLLEKRLSGRFSVVNASISGETTTGGLSRIDEALEKFSPSIVVLELGANDGLQGQPLSIVRENLEAMIRACRKRHARVLLVGMRLPPNYGRKYSGDFAQMYPEIAKARKIALVPFMMEGFAGNLDDFQPDGRHPSVSAQKMVLENIWKELGPMLGR